jgi:hypothetical protein
MKQKPLTPLEEPMICNVALTLLADDEITGWEPIEGTTIEEVAETYCASLKDVSETQPPWIHIKPPTGHVIHVFRATESH